ncbi:NAD(P)H-quinone oxidoreductase subunit 5 chloroplastic, partial [Bienertia sinuspersici]
SGGWYDFVINATFSVSIAYLGIFIAFFCYKPVYSSFQNFDLINSFDKTGQKRIFGDKIITIIYNWSFNRGYVDAFYGIFLIKGIRGLAELVSFFDRRIIDGIPNGFGVTSFFIGEGIKYGGGGRISSYLFWYLFYVSIFLILYYVYID